MMGGASIGQPLAKHPNSPFTVPQRPGSTPDGALYLCSVKGASDTSSYTQSLTPNKHQWMENLPSTGRTLEQGRAHLGAVRSECNYRQPRTVS